MTTRIPQNELQNHTSEVLRRVQDGERIEITVDGLIAATAAGRDLPVYTRDRDFVGLDGVEVVLA